MQFFMPLHGADIETIEQPIELLTRQGQQRVITLSPDLTFVVPHDPSY